jgi:hypothetical protein
VFEVGGGNKSGKDRRKCKICSFFICAQPDEILSQNLQQIFQKGEFIEANIISHGKGCWAIFVFNIDKGGDETTVMGRFLNQPKCNQPRKNILLGQLNDGANENSFNITKFMIDKPGGLEESIRFKLEENGFDCNGHPQDELLVADEVDSEVRSNVVLHASTYYYAFVNVFPFALTTFFSSFSIHSNVLASTARLYGV